MEETREQRAERMARTVDLQRLKERLKEIAIKQRLAKKKARRAQEQYPVEGMNRVIGESIDWTGVLALRTEATALLILRSAFRTRRAEHAHGMRSWPGDKLDRLVRVLRFAGMRVTPLSMASCNPLELNVRLIVEAMARKYAKTAEQYASDQIRERSRRESRPWPQRTDGA